MAATTGCFVCGRAPVSWLLARAGRWQEAGRRRRAKARAVRAGAHAVHGICADCGGPSCRCDGAGCRRGRRGKFPCARPIGKAAAFAGALVAPHGQVPSGGPEGGRTRTRGRSVGRPLGACRGSEGAAADHARVRRPVICATCSPWKRAISSSLAEGMRLPSPADKVPAP